MCIVIGPIVIYTICNSTMFDLDTPAKDFVKDDYTMNKT